MKFKLYIDEDITVSHEVIVEYHNEDKLEEILDEIEKVRSICGISQYVDLLEENGVDIVEVLEGSLETDNIECSELSLLS